MVKAVRIGSSETVQFEVEAAEACDFVEAAEACGFET